MQFLQLSTILLVARGASLLQRCKAGRSHPVSDAGAAPSQDTHNRVPSAQHISRQVVACKYLAKAS